MSGPVFVIDAQERPLMPLAEAYARKLLRSGKAQRWPHPTLTIIQLNRTVAQPVLRPVLLGVAIHRSAAELFVLANGPQAAFPLLSIVVNLPRRRWRAQPHRIARRRVRTRRSIGRLAIGAVISTLWRLLPLSHIVLLRTPALRTTDLSRLRRLRRFLTDDALQVAIARSAGSAPPAFPPDLFALLQAVAANPAAYTPSLAAAVILPPQNPLRLTRWTDDADTDADIPASGIGVVRKPALIGIIAYDSTDDERVLEVPIAASPAGVIWRYVALAPHTPLQRWPLTPVVLLPLVARAVQEAVTLWKDDLDAFMTFYLEDDADAPTRD